MLKNKVIWQTGLAVLQTLTGAILLGFAFFHLMGNSVINFGENWMNFYTSHLDKSNFLIKTALWLIAVALIGHGLNGFRITLRYFKKIPEIPRFLADTNYRGSFLWCVHFVTGSIMAVALIFHLTAAWFGASEPITTVETIKFHLKNGYYFALMILLLLSGIFHACYGTRTILVKYGILTAHQSKIGFILFITGIVLAILGINNLLLYK